MSAQKYSASVSGDHIPSQKHDYHSDHNRSDPRARKYRRYPILNYDETSTSQDVEYHRPCPPRRQRRAKNVSLSQTESQIIRHRIREVEILRQKLEELERSTTSESESHKTASTWSRIKSSSCFSFFSIINRKRSKAEFKYTESHINVLQALKTSNIRESDFTDDNKEAAADKRKGTIKESRHHKITNNNTIVLPETHNTDSGEQFAKLTEKIDRQREEIREIKESLQLCINLLRSNYNIEPNKLSECLEEYIKLNWPPYTKYAPCLSEPLDPSSLMKFMTKNSQKRLAPDLKTKCLESLHTIRLTPKTTSTTVYTTSHERINYVKSKLVRKPSKCQSEKTKATGSDLSKRSLKSSRSVKFSQDVYLIGTIEKKDREEAIRQRGSYFIRFVKFILCKAT